MPLGMPNAPKRGWFSSVTMSGQIAFQGELSYYLLYLLDYSLEVTSIKSKPFTIDYEIAGKKREHTPAFLVIEDGYEVITDCKRSVSLSSEKTLAWYEGVGEWCAENGYAFRVYTEKQILSGFSLENIMRLKRYALHKVTVDFRASVFSVASTAPDSLSLQALIDELPQYSRQTALESIFHMAYRHEVELDINTGPISLASKVSLAGRANIAGMAGMAAMAAMAGTSYQTGSGSARNTSRQATDPIGTSAA